MSVIKSFRVFAVPLILKMILPFMIRTKSTSVIFSSEKYRKLEFSTGKVHYPIMLSLGDFPSQHPNRETGYPILFITRVVYR